MEGEDEVVEGEDPAGEEYLDVRQRYNPHADPTKFFDGDRQRATPPELGCKGIDQSLF